MTILFERLNRQYGWMSNFYPCPIKISHRGAELEFPTSEHLFQWTKFYLVDPTLAENIRTSKTPKTARTLGNSIKIDTEHWNKIRVKTMKRVLELKLEQHPDLVEKLLETKNQPLVEWAPWDAFWGNGKHGDGQNWMGKLWMELRDETLRKKRQNY